MMPPSFVRIFGIPVVRAAPEEAVAAVAELGDRREPALVAYVNAHTLNLAYVDEDYRALLASAALVLNDGVGIQLAARMRRMPFPANLNGSDFNPRILELAAARRWPVFFLGGASGVAEEAVRRLTARIPDLLVAGTHQGYLADDGEAIAAISSSGARVLMVAMGNPLQERWLQRNLAATGARIGVGVGAFFDFTAGAQRRAPAWLNKIGLEWLFRLFHDPGRLWRRYIVGNPLFLWRAWKTRRADTATSR
jgi:exopolysaccharide biosynthesis WecB/TagA/CpsF family protein